MRRLASLATPEMLDLLISRLQLAKAPVEKKSILQNMLVGLKGRRPNGQAQFGDSVIEKENLFASKDNEMRSLALSLAVVFGDAKAFKQLREQLASTKSDLPSRQEG